MLIKRIIQPKIEASLFKGKAIIIYGARQVGKTTLVKEIQKKFVAASLYLNCDEPDIRAALTNTTSTELKAYFGTKKIIIIDEAQRVENIGLTLKLLVDAFPELQIIATGSSSFELSNRIVEPLTGRAFEFLLYPFSSEELGEQYAPLEIKRLLEQRLIYGMYPEIVEQTENIATRLKNIARSYAYKDILFYQHIRNPDILEKLLSALALQIGHEVSYSELAKLLSINRVTVENYVAILEKAFIIFRLRPYSTNPRKELAKLRKIYFYDTGIRNALINNLNPLNLRSDAGALWKNFWILERLKNNHNHGRDARAYFWRNYQKQEIDYIEEANGKLAAFECKWSVTKPARAPSGWRALYPGASFTAVHPGNFLEIK